jgi:hypothetical protein
MKGFIDVKCTFGKEIGTGFTTVTTTIKLKNLEVKYHSLKDLSSMVVPVRHEMKFSRVQLIAARRNLTGNLEDKGGIVFPKNPAEFNHVIKEDGTDYYVVKTDIGTPEKPEPKTFYLNQDQRDMLEFFKLEYEFTDTTEFKDPEDTEDND